MAKEIRSLKELSNYIENQYLIQFLNKIGEEVKGVLRNFILNDLYRAYTPSEYQRTEEFLNAVDVKSAKKIGDSYQVEVFINPDKMSHMSAEGNSGWLAHTSSLGEYRGDTDYNGKDIAWWLIYWLETGDNSSPYSRGKIGMIENTREWIKDDNYIRNRLQELFESKGIRVE